ncbi:SusC/RagA family TonB-linked outer membrane protein [Flavobacterium sp. RHBU_3]|uniref:SusC/RagA family TonB-linked outer membrane protein n=1 Tax=Flavobacterium sp. RHBU_3 TaxID=3391184 RepID=UPI003984845D
MKSKLFLFAFLLFSAFCFAQDVQISGQVTEAATGLPIPGASVTVKNSTVSTATDIDGNYTIKVAKGATLIFSYIGFETVEKTATGGTISVSLAENVKTLDEVVVIGYGSQKKKEVTGAVSMVSAETIDKMRPVKIEQALQGTVSGVNVTTTSGSPGAGLSIRIRGIGTNGNADPYVLIDGYAGELGLLNPADIESITVLKDAQAAIYGVLGANGVILVTTKKGRKNQKPKLVYNVYSGFQETSRKLPLLNATEYAALLNETYANGGQTIPYPNLSGLGRGTDWQDQVFSKGVPITNHDLSLSGGSETITYSLGVSSLDQKGIVGEDKSGFNRNTARLGLGIDITPKLKLNTNMIFTQFDRKSLNENVLGSVLFNALNVPATLSPYDENGDYTLVPSTTGFGTEIINPLAQIQNTYNDYNFRKLNGTFGLDYEVIKGLKVTGRIGFNSANSEGRNFSPEVNYGGKIYDVTRSSVTQSAANDKSYTLDLFANYDRTFDEAHHITATVGTTQYKSWGGYLSGTGYDVPYNSWQYASINLTTGFLNGKTSSAYSYDQRRVSHFGRLQYDYKGRYLLSGMLRRDLSTNFAPEYRVAWFPSVTAGWNISEESFFNKEGIISFAKLRASYGNLGSDSGLGSSIFFSGLNGEATYVFNGVMVNGAATGTVANPRAKWEISKKLDIGADINLFKDKVSIVADYFDDTRSNQLIPNIPTTGLVGIGAPGASAPTVNAGTVKNSGFEFAVGYKNNLSDNFRLEANYNVTFIKNKVTEVNNGTGYYPGGTFGLSEQPSRMEIGMPMGYFYGYKMEGIFQNQAEIDAAPSQAGLGSATTSPGDIRFKDVNGDGVITAADKTNLGNPIPNATMGFNLSLSYKGFDFTSYVFASLGNDMVRAYERNVPNANRLNYVLDRWTGEGTSNSVPRVTTGATNNTLFSSYYVEDASYCRIQNAQIGYSVNPEWLGNVVSKARIYFAVNNLYTFTKYKGYDPGASSGAPIGSGIDYGFYPVPRVYMIGANINF